MNHTAHPRAAGRPHTAGARLALSAAVLGILLAAAAKAEQPPAPCHPNPHADADRHAVANRGDVVNLPQPLKDRLVQLADRPHTFLPMQVFAEAPSSSRLFQYYLLDATGFEPNVFTARFTGINDQVQLTATGGNCGLATVGAVRVVIEPKPGLPTDPNDAKAFIDVFTDISPLFVINNESGWYEGWMIHDMIVAPVNSKPRSDGLAQFGTLLPVDAKLLKKMGNGHNVPGAVFTVDGNPAHLPNEFDHFPDAQTNVVSIHESMGAFNAMQQSDVHSYWEFNYLGTNWIHPLYELPYTGGFADSLDEPPDALADGEIGKLQSIVPGSGPAGIRNDPRKFGDNPNLPRDPDKFDSTVDAQREFRQRGVPSGLAHEIYLDVYERLASFEPNVKSLKRRLDEAYALEVSRVDLDGDGTISAPEGDADTPTDDFPDNRRLYLPPSAFNRFAVTREINDGLLAPRFAPSQRAWVLSGHRVAVNPSVPASAGRDSDDR